MKVLHINGVIHRGSTGSIIDSINNVLLKNDEKFGVAYGIGKHEKDGFKFCYRYEQALYRRCSMITGYRYGFAPFSTQRLIRIIDKFNPSIIHIHSINGNCVNIYTLLEYIKRNKIPLVITNHAEFFYTANCTSTYGCRGYISGCQECHNKDWATDYALFPNTAKSWLKMKNAFNGFSRIISVCVSEFSLKCAKSSPILRDCKHLVIYNGIDTSVFKPSNDIDIRKKYKISSMFLYVFVTSEFSKNKDHLKGGYWLLELAKLYSKEEATFLIVGSGSCDVKLNNVIFAGVIRDKNLLANIYSQSDVSLSFSKSESFGMTCAESLCCGTPFIGFKCGGTESIALERYTRFCDYGDIKTMKKFIDEFSFINKKQGHIISLMANKIYSSEVMAEKYYEVYKSFR